MEGWVDLGYPAMHQLGVELTISRSQVWCPNHYTTEPPEIIRPHAFTSFFSFTVLHSKEMATSTWHAPEEEQQGDATMPVDWRKEQRKSTHCTAISDLSSYYCHQTANSSTHPDNTRCCKFYLPVPDRTDSSSDTEFWSQTAAAQFLSRA